MVLLRHLILYTLVRELGIGLLIFGPMLGFLLHLSGCGCVFYNTSPPLLFCR